MRGKETYVVTNDSKILFSSLIEEEQVKSGLQIPELKETGADLLATEIKNSKGEVRAAQFSKLTSIKNSYVMISTAQIKWTDLAGPILNSSLSLIILLIFFSILIAFSISGSLARPIEKISEETARIGIGEWSPISSNDSTAEISRLAKSFNLMIENLKSREADLKIANEKLIHSESLAALGRIGAGIAHEVKNPLASILSYGQLIEMNMKTLEKSADTKPEMFEKIKNYNKMILDDTRRASKIISDLLTFSRQKEVITERVLVQTFLEDAALKLKALCETKNILFSCDLAAVSQETAIKADPDQMYQVLFNLVQNASHALVDSDVVVKKIRVSAKSSDTQVFISVSDNGPGISKENLPKIFEPFFSTKKIGEGTGLGLAICYGIVLKHGGQIRVQSEVSVGTNFELVLPIA